ncbi:MAG TPA: N-acetyltransferase, partial [Caulobacteraceae bacterium]|nr:N-acetyltransferase [Caulobacteraceae bacterium]
MNIRPAREADHAAIREVVIAAFGQPDEADLIERLRADGDALIELVAEEGGEVVGHILFSPMASQPPAKIAALAPVAVKPDLQRGGIGIALNEAGLDACRAAGVEAVIVLGHADYYPRFGFSAELARRVRAPFSGPSFMAL